MAFINVFLDEFNFLLDEVDRDQLEMNVHLFADFDCFLHGQFECLDGFIVLLELIVRFCLLHDGISDLCLSKILLGVFDLLLDLLKPFVQGFLDIHF